MNKELDTASTECSYEIAEAQKRARHLVRMLLYALAEVEEMRLTAAAAFIRQGIDQIIEDQCLTESDLFQIQQPAAN